MDAVKELVNELDRGYISTRHRAQKVLIEQQATIARQEREIVELRAFAESLRHFNEKLRSRVEDLERKLCQT